MSTPGKIEHLDPVKAAQAAKELIESIGAACGQDDELLADMVEGETELFDIFDRLLERRAVNKALAAGLAGHIEVMKDRKDRFEKAAELDRTLIEQGLSVAGLLTVRRPTATLSLSLRGVKIVIDEEGDIPADFWKAGDPKLDKKALGEALAAREAALAALADLPDDPGARAAAIAEAAPPIPGAHLENAPPSLTIRER